MTDTPRKRALVVRSFNDEGTGASFQKDDTPLLDAGTFGNYEAAGLVTAAPAAKATSTPKLAAKPKGKPKAKAKAAPKVPAQPVVAPPADGAADA